MAQITLHALIEGKVQGVFYRKSTQKEARQLGVNGWVRNLSDGRVEALAQGDEESVRLLEKWFWQGPIQARVSDVVTAVINLDEQIEGFSIR